MPTGARNAIAFGVAAGGFVATFFASIVLGRGQHLLAAGSAVQIIRPCRQFFAIINVIIVTLS